ncbi:hypothetical protein SUV65_10665, partial [Streptococcus agalactiae]
SCPLGFWASRRGTLHMKESCNRSGFGGSVHSSLPWSRSGLSSPQPVSLSHQSLGRVHQPRHIPARLGAGQPRLQFRWGTR